MQASLKRPTHFDYIPDSGFDSPSADTGSKLRAADVLIGKHSALRFAAAELELPLRCVALLTGATGQTGLKGVVVARSDSGLRSLEDLDGRELIIGMPQYAEKHAAALAALKESQAVPGATTQRTFCREAVLDVVAGTSDAAVVSEYSLHLLRDRELVGEAQLSEIARTASVPWIGVFLRDAASAVEVNSIIRCLTRDAAQAPDLLRALKSARGFVSTAGE